MSASTAPGYKTNYMFNKQAQRNMSIEAKFNDQYPKMLAVNIFPIEKISSSWWYYSHLALLNASPYLLGVSAQEYKILTDLEIGDKINMHQFAILNTQLEKTTPIQLSMQVEQFADLMIECNEHAVFWNNVNKNMRDALEKKLVVEQDELDKIAERSLLNEIKAEA